MLEALGPKGSRLGTAIAKLRAWESAGADRSSACAEVRGNCRYQHRDAIKIMDAWWPRAVDGIFKPRLGAVSSARSST
jgi:hypothetical protein